MGDSLVLGEESDRYLVHRWMRPPLRQLLSPWLTGYCKRSRLSAPEYSLKQITKDKGGEQRSNRTVTDKASVGSALPLQKTTDHNFLSHDKFVAWSCDNFVAWSILSRDQFCRVTSEVVANSFTRYLTCCRRTSNDNKKREEKLNLRKARS